VPLTSASSFRHYVSQVKVNQTASIPSRQQYKLAPLQGRTIIQLSGVDSADFLQTLITNDVRLLLSGNNPRQCIYSFLLHNNGRIEADMFVYYFSQHPYDFLLEVDSAVAYNIIKLIKFYKIRRKFSIKQIYDCLVAAIFPQFPDEPLNLPQENLKNESPETSFMVQDPRGPHFGFRAISLNSKDTSSFSTISPPSGTFNWFTIQSGDSSEYRTFRYRLGVGEGAIDFPPQSVFPFEANADLLNAVSFDKGCYVGQELTARTFHTGVVRKRYVPIELIGDETLFGESLPVQNVIIEPNEEDGKPLVMGRFRANLGRYGIAALKYGDLFNKPQEENSLVKTENLLPTIK